MVVSRKFGDLAPDLCAARKDPQAPDRWPGDVVMTRTKLFRSNRSQAVRLPKSLAFPDNVKAVSTVREGKRRVIAPSNAVWADFFDSPGIHLPARGQPALQDRGSH
jgi:antitoxin VapB